MLPLLMVGWYFSSRNTKSDDDFDSKAIPDLYKIANSIFIQFCLVILFFFTAGETYSTKRFLFIYIALLCILIPLEKVLNKRLMLFLNNKGVYKKRILIVGAGKTGMEFFNILNSNRHLGYEVIGFLDDQEKDFLSEQYLGKTGKIEDLLADPLVKFDEVVVALPNNAHDKIQYIADVVGRQAVKLRIIPAYHELINTNYNVSILYGLPMITLRNEPLDNIHFSLIKRLFDLLFSSIIVFSICSWLFPIIALAIVIDSKGPVFFIQERWGKRNRKIRCFKFRSMHVSSTDTDEKNGKYQQARKNDPRITRVGAFIRRTSLDEFPQFLNVLLGDMSVVGPRPHPTPLNLESKEIIDNYLVRHLVKPGITGWAQVNGYRGETRDPALMRARVNHDIWYIENWSLLLDLKIVFLTVWNTLASDERAY